MNINQQNKQRETKIINLSFILIIFICLCFSIACKGQTTDPKPEKSDKKVSPTPQIIADSFAYPIGKVEKREQIGTVGNADGRYLCHLHFELRDETCPMWNEAGAGYSAENSGWRDPSKFIDEHLK